MTSGEVIRLALVTLGGLALFLFGIHIMTAGLRQAAAERLRAVLALATHNRLAGIGLGTALGFLIHSSAASVMLVGLVHAGLVRLAGALPVLFGANVGTTLSMQVISLQLTDLAFALIALGFLLYMTAPREVLKHAGRALLGIGILFLGMDLMSGAIEPHRDDMKPWLERIDGSTPGGMLLGVLGAALFTALIQSSGATIGMCFVLIGSGVFSGLEQVYPIVLGAHIGTSATALIASIGTSVEARRTALGNLGFNLFNTLLALLAAPLFFRLIPLTAESLVHQTANLHTAIMAVAALLLLPFAGSCARAIEAVTPSKTPEPTGTFLDPALKDSPENAMEAALRELGRSAAICRESLRHAEAHLRTRDRKNLRQIAQNEQALDEIKETFRNYLASLAESCLSRRQVLLAQSFNRIMNDIERIGDHIENMAILSREMAVAGPPDLSVPETRAPLYTLHKRTGAVLDNLVSSLAEESDRFSETADAILRERARFVETYGELRNTLNDKVVRHEIHPGTALLLSEYLMTGDRLVRHCKAVATEEQQPFFHLKPSRLKQAPKPR